MPKQILILLTSLFATTGCTSVALKREAVAHAGSATSLRYQEVLENLAMTAANPDILPAYSSIYAGTSDINDVVKGTSISNWARTALKAPVLFSTFFSTQTADFSGSRAVKSNWTLDPSIAPEKIRAMRAACRWVVLGPEAAGPDVLMLMEYCPPEYADPARTSQDDRLRLERVLVHPGSQKGYYFNVADQLKSLPPDWLHRACLWSEIPHDAVYRAGCHGKYLWVGPEDMAAFSQFTLVLQRIARQDLGLAYFPKVDNRSVSTNFSFVESGVEYKATTTVYVDEDGNLTPGVNSPAIPFKTRLDNTGAQSDLRSVINTAVKTSSP